MVGTDGDVTFTFSLSEQNMRTSVSNIIFQLNGCRSAAKPYKIISHGMTCVYKAKTGEQVHRLSVFLQYPHLSVTAFSEKLLNKSKFA